VFVKPVGDAYAPKTTPTMARPHSHTERRLGGRRSTGKSSLTILAKPVGAWGYVSAIDSTGRTYRTEVLYVE